MELIDDLICRIIFESIRYLLIYTIKLISQSREKIRGCDGKWQSTNESRA